MPGLGAGPDPFASASGATKIPGYTSVACLFTWLGTKGDYSSIAKRNEALRGWRRHVSTVTREGRLNMVIGTYITTAAVGVYLWKRYKNKAITDKTPWMLWCLYRLHFFVITDKLCLDIAWWYLFLDPMTLKLALLCAFQICSRWAFHASKYKCWGINKTLMLNLQTPLAVLFYTHGHWKIDSYNKV